MPDTPAPVPTEQLATEPVADTLPVWSGRGRPPAAIAKDIREKKVAFYKKKKRNGQIQITGVQKFDIFLDEFIRNGGNATEAAWKVYNCKNRAVAAAIGKDQLQKAKDLGRVFMESEGAGYGDLLKIAIKKTAESEKPDWWDRLMKIAGYEDFINKAPRGFQAGPTNIINVIGKTQKDLASEYVEGEYVEEDGNKEN